MLSNLYVLIELADGDMIACHVFNRDEAGKRELCRTALKIAADIELDFNTALIINMDESIKQHAFEIEDSETGFTIFVI